MHSCGKKKFPMSKTVVIAATLDAKEFVATQWHTRAPHILLNQKQEYSLTGRSSVCRAELA
jgi:hypothetical protein